MKVSYHRVHAVFVVGESLLHVFYTARSPDPNLETFNNVLNTIHEET
jgi:hypothetical protein